jgi:hypothetical protein
MVLVHYRSPKVFSLGKWTSRIPTGLACPVVLKDTAEVWFLLFTGLSPSVVGLSSAVQLETRLVTSICGPYNPDRAEARSVWAAPLSLATTQGIISFPQGTKMFQFPWFPPCDLWIQSPVPEDRSGGFPHSDTPGYNVCTRLPEVYRSVPRPSSAFGAKASTVRP